MQICFADYDRAGRLETSRHLCVFVGKTIVEDRAGGCSAYAGGVDIVLQRYGYAVQRTAKFAGALFSFKFTRLGERLISQNSDESIQLRIVGLNARQASLSELDRRNGARTNPRRSFGQTERR